MTPDAGTRLRAAIAAAEPALRAIADATAAAPRAPGKWSPKEIIGHLVDSASNNHGRFVRGATQDDLVFAGYAQEAWVSLQRYRDADWNDLITLWASFNRHIAGVMDLVPADARTRVRSRHNLDQVAMRAPPTAADATLDYFMHDYVDHLEMHVRQVLGEGWRA